MKLKLMSCIVALAGLSVLQGAPYLGWASDYTGSEANTIGLWKFDATPGYNLDSYTGAANPNPYPTSTINLTTAPVTTGVAGKFGQAISIIDNPGDNSSRAFTAGSNTELFHGSALSVELWYQPPSVLDTTGYLFDKMYNTTNGVRLMFTGGNLVLTVGNGSATTSLSVTAPTLSASTWYNFAVTYENVAGDGELKIFMNGNLLGEKTTDDFGDLAAGTRQWTVGNRSGSTFSPLLGTYDNFRLADVAYDYAPVPEPGAFGLTILGAAAFLGRRKRNLA